MEALKQKQHALDAQRDELFSHPLLELQRKNHPKLISNLVEFLHQDQKKPTL